MTIIRQEDLIQSIADALQYISYYHPVDYIKNLAAAYEREESPAAKDAIAQILTNSRMCADGGRPDESDAGFGGGCAGFGVQIEDHFHMCADETERDGHHAGDALCG